MGKNKRMMLSKGDIAIRPLEKGDLPALRQWINDPLIMRRIGIEGIRTEEMQRQWFADLQDDDGRAVWAVCHGEVRSYIGNVSLYDIDRKHGHAGLAVFIGEESNRGKGYGGGAVRLMLECAFRDMGLHRVYCKTEESFPGALRLYESIGFTREGVLREHERFDGSYVDKVLYGILEDEFRLDCVRVREE
ncbi:MAG: GNAT family N-acetyltransferase [Candidatus Latescibacteria bacterium]|nr:GNAT family N-acetyltransferase [Candidatus Latescibacterota bacterium]